jgi:hypothetical protein
MLIRESEQQSIVSLTVVDVASSSVNVDYYVIIRKLIYCGMSAESRNYEANRDSRS